MSERLEEIKKELELDWSDISYVVNQADVKWLINRIEELEEERDEWKDATQYYYMTNQELREQNKRYCKAINYIIEKVMLFGTNEEVYDAIQDVIKELEGGKMIDKERLEEIKEKYSEVTVLEYINDVEIVGVDIKDLVWLINRVEELELELELEKSTNKDFEAHLLKQVESAKVQNERYKQALEFYADEENYCVRFEDDYEPILQDNGKTARQALERDEN